MFNETEHRLKNKYKMNKIRVIGGRTHCCLLWLGNICFAAILLFSHVALALDCTKATTQTEKTICSDPTLLKLDVELNAVYKKALRESPTPELLKKEQRDWLKLRDAGVGTAQLQQIYRERINTLHSLSNKTATIDASGKPKSSHFKCELDPAIEGDYATEAEEWHEELLTIGPTGIHNKFNFKITASTPRFSREFSGIINFNGCVGEASNVDGMNSACVFTFKYLPSTKDIIVDSQTNCYVDVDVLPFGFYKHN